MMTATPHELSNGRYRVVLTANGGGRSSLHGLALNRWPADAVEDAHGFFVYLRDLDSGSLWSAGLQPVPAMDAHPHANAAFRCAADAAAVTYLRCAHEIDSRLRVCVDAQDDLEVRHLRLHNMSARPRRIEVTSCIEIALADPQADLGHPSFLKLFVQTACNPASGVLTATRRARGNDERWPTLFHAVRGMHAVAWETDRARFIGRGRSAAHPALRMCGNVGNVLDALFALRVVVTLAPGASREIGLLLGLADDAAAASALAIRHGATPFAASASADTCVEEAPALRHGFAADGREYRMTMPWLGHVPARPPMPWINVLANERFGCLVSESGAGCTWSRNSQQNRITPWSDDPVCDPHDEAFYLRDAENGGYWSILPGPVPAPVAYEVAHGFGYSRYTASACGITHTATIFVARHDPVKCVRVELRNDGDAPRRLSLFAYRRLVLGSLPDAQRRVQTWTAAGTLCARRAAGSADDFADGIVFALAVGGDAGGHSCARPAFIGANRSSRNPLAVERDVLDGHANVDADACLAQRRTLTLAAGESAVVSFLLGEVTSPSALDALTPHYADPANIDAALDAVQRFWRESLGVLRVQTPSPAIDTMLNGWLPYQALACRLWARTAFYQSSGAYGFRDQLQDAGNLAWLWPQRTREQILLHAQRQFVEGDALHWWHEGTTLRGLRTRFADDLLWLPFIAERYVRDTGDAAIWEVELAFLQAPPLQAGQGEHYLQAVRAGAVASLYEHCCRALDRSLTRGAHGLPLMGSGDWNDGMNRVGHAGRGESVWLGFFLHALLPPFIALATQRGETARAARYAAYRQDLQVALDTAGWDGRWYRRAYFDDGTPLGSQSNPECRIDALAQAWAVLSGVASGTRAAQAMDAVESQLIDEAHGLIRLLTPPFVDWEQDPGYIKGYVAGVRENGGQYTHAACWVIAAAAALGRRDRAARWLERLAPQWHARDDAALARYQVEPYVIAADIYGAEPHVGRGGWTWYTGAAGWAWRVAIESVLGLRIVDGRRLLLQPCVPDDWPGYRIEYRPPGRRARYLIDVRNPQACSECVVALQLDNVPLRVDDGIAAIELHDDDAVHRLLVTLGPAT